MIIAETIIIIIILKKFAFYLPFQTTGMANRVRSFPIACFRTDNMEYLDRSGIFAGNARRDFVKSTAITI